MPAKSFTNGDLEACAFDQASEVSLNEAGIEAGFRKSGLGQCKPEQRQPIQDGQFIVAADVLKPSFIIELKIALNSCLP